LSTQPSGVGTVHCRISTSRSRIGSPDKVMELSDCDDSDYPADAKQSNVETIFNGINCYPRYPDYFDGLWLVMAGCWGTILVCGLAADLSVCCYGKPNEGSENKGIHFAIHVRMILRNGSDPDFLCLMVFFVLGLIIAVTKT
jgi:hypothetical protein